MKSKREEWDEIVKPVIKESLEQILLETQDLIERLDRQRYVPIVLGSYIKACDLKKELEKAIERLEIEISN